MFITLFCSFLFAQEPSTDHPIGEERSTTEAPIEASTIVSFFYTGNLHGFEGNKFPFAFQDAFGEKNEKFTVNELQTFHGLLTQNEWIMYTKDYKTESLVSFFTNTEIQCSETNSLFGWTRGNNILFAQDNIEMLTAYASSPKNYTQQVCRNGEGLEAILLHPTSVQELPKFSLDAFSFRRGAILRYNNGEQRSGLLVQQSIYDLTRIQQYIQDDKNSISLFIDAGSFVDGWSNVPSEKLSANRIVAYESLESLQPTALGVGIMEILDGAQNFFSEIETKNLPYIATNWETENPALQLPKSRNLSINTSSGTKKIAFLSILDPQWMDEVPMLEKEGVQISDPLAALNKEIQNLYQSSNPPDIVILLTTASAKIQEQIRLRAKGVAIMMGDPTFATFRVISSETKLKEYDQNSKGAPITLPLEGLHKLDLVFLADKPASIITRPITIDDSVQPNPKSLSAINQVRSRVYPLFSDPILSPPGTGLEAKFSNESWQKILCESIRNYTKADTVLMREFPDAPAIAGIIPELTLLDQLGGHDTLVEYMLTGTQLTSLLSKINGTIPVTCGAQFGSLSTKGRGLENDQMYSLVTTQHTMTQYELDASIGKVQSKKPLDPLGQRAIVDEKNRVQTTNLVILQSLRSLRAKYGIEKIANYLLQESPKEKPPQLLLRIRKLGFSTEQFGGMENPSFASIPDTLANAASSSSLGNALDIAIDYTSLFYNQDLRFKTSFGTLKTGSTEQETKDDWTISTSLSIPNKQFRALGPLQWTIFTEMLYDSEFTPTEQEDGTLNPKQSDLSLSLGLQSLSYGWIKTIRLSGFGNRDFSVYELPRYEFGFKMEWESKATIFSNLLWTSTGDIRLYADNPEDNASDLRFRGLAETRLSLPLTRYLALSVYGQVFAIKGRVEENKDFGIANNVGLALDILGIFAMIEE